MGQQRQVKSLNQKEARKKKMTRNDQRVGMSIVQSKKTVRGWTWPRRDVTMEAGNNRFGVKQISVNRNKQGKENRAN